MTSVYSADLPDPTPAEMRRIVRFLWGAYGLALAAAVASFAAMVATGDISFLVASLTLCAAAWTVTGPLDGARSDLRADEAADRAGVS
jgi:hypothetical protein